MLRIISILLLLLTAAPGTVLAARVLICRSSYDLVVTSEQSQEKAQRIVDHIVGELEAAGDWKGIRTADECDSRDDLLKAKDWLDVEEAILIKVRETSVHYDYQVVSTTAETAGELDGTFAELLEATAATALKMLPEVKQVEAPGPVEASEPDEPAEVTEPEQPPDEGMSPVPFWVALSVTGALAITTGALEIAGYSKLQDYKDQEIRLSSEETDLTRLRTAEIVLFSLALAGAVTTTVLGVLTFGKKSKEDDTNKVALGFNGIGLYGEF